MLDNLSDKSFKERLPSLHNNFQMFPKLVAQVLGQCWLKKVFARSKTFHIIRVQLQSVFYLISKLDFPRNQIQLQSTVLFDFKLYRTLEPYVHRDSIKV